MYEFVVTRKIPATDTKGTEVSASFRGHKVNEFLEATLLMVQTHTRLLP